MNERIKELIEKSGLDYDELWEKDQLAVDKFAELIVQECVDRIKNTTFLGDTKEWFEPSDVLWTAAQQVKEHFGVEE